DRIMKSMVLTNQAIVGTVNAGRSGFVLAVQRLEQAMYLIPHSVRGIITKRMPLEAAPDALREPHGVKDIVQIGPGGPQPCPNSRTVSPSRPQPDRGPGPSTVGRLRRVPAGCSEGRRRWPPSG